jgi:hypothetical protein
MNADTTEQADRAADAAKHLAAARDARAGGPGPDAEALRRAYLDLLKLGLCDLVGSSTQSVGALQDGTVMSRELRGEGIRLRAAGMDWPLQGLTMVGLGRLDDLQACVESVVADDVGGDVIEAGAWRGGASLFARAALDALGDDRTVWVADSFQGFPAAGGGDPEEGRLSAFDFLAVPLDEVRESFRRLGCERGVEFVPGFFEDTLPRLSGRRWSIVRLDADTYGPTRLALQALYPGLSAGGYVVIDDYGSFPGCRRAVDEFRSENGITEPLEPIDFSGARWRRESTSPLRPAAPAPGPSAGRPAAPVRSRPAPPPPTARELELARELAAVQARLAAAEAAIGLRPWLRRKLGRGPR